jgi:hypothetical protein
LVMGHPLRRSRSWRRLSGTCWAITSSITARCWQLATRRWRWTCSSTPSASPTLHPAGSSAGCPLHTHRVARHYCLRMPRSGAGFAGWGHGRRTSFAKHPSVSHPTKEGCSKAQGSYNQPRVAVSHAVLPGGFATLTAGAVFLGWAAAAAGSSPRPSVTSRRAVEGCRCACRVYCNDTSHQLLVTPVRLRALPGAPQ